MGDSTPRRLLNLGQQTVAWVSALFLARTLIIVERESVGRARAFHERPDDSGDMPPPVSPRLRNVIPVDIYPLGELLRLHVCGRHERPQSPRETTVRGVRDYDAFDVSLVPFSHRAGLAAAGGAVQEQLPLQMTIRPSLSNFHFHHVTLQARGGGVHLKAWSFQFSVYACACVCVCLRVCNDSEFDSDMECEICKVHSTLTRDSTHTIGVPLTHTTKVVVSLTHTNLSQQRSPASDHEVAALNAIGMLRQIDPLIPLLLPSQKVYFHHEHRARAAHRSSGKTIF